MNETAIVIFAFNRPEHLKQTLTYLSRSARLNELPLVFYVDGSRRKSDIVKVKEVINIAQTFYHESKTIICRDINFGLRKSVISGLSEIFLRYERAIILEDDICTHEDFLSYHLECLDRYAEQDDIWSISGFVIPSLGQKIFNSTGCEIAIGPRASSWGWSTWNTCWQKAVWENDAILNHLNIKNAIRYYKTGGDKCRMLLRELMGRSSSWAIRWDYNHFMNKSYCIYPSFSLVSNIGLDNSGTHSTRVDKYMVSLSSYTPIKNYPDELKPHAVVFGLFSRLNRKYYRDITDLSVYIYLKIKAWINNGRTGTAE